MILSFVSLAQDPIKQREKVIIVIMKVQTQYQTLQALSAGNNLLCMRPKHKDSQGRAREHSILHAEAFSTVSHALAAAKFAVYPSTSFRRSR